MTKLEQWQKMSSDLKMLKEMEANLRRELCEEVLKGRVGDFTEKCELYGSRVKVSSKVNRRIDKTVLTTLWDALSTEERECIEFKPELKIAKFKKLSEINGKHYIYEAIIETPGMPVLEIL